MQAIVTMHTRPAAPVSGDSNPGPVPGVSDPGPVPGDSVCPWSSPWCLCLTLVQSLVSLTLVQSLVTLSMVQSLVTLSVHGPVPGDSV